MTKTTAWYADRYHNRYGFALIPLQEQSKLPIEKDWGNNTLNGNAANYFEHHPTHNIGLELGLSRMCSLDIDCMESFKVILDEFGIDATELDSYPTVQGSSKGSRILFRVPDDMQLNYCKVNWPRRDEPKKHYTVFELRASSEGKQRFDVLPPSIHPDTKQPYRWITQPPKQGEWPTPPAWLTAIWTAWESFKPQLKDACPWVTPEPRQAKPKPAPTGDDKASEVVEGYKRANPLLLQLERYGYSKKGRRYLSPHSGTGLPGVHILDSETCWIHHASDPLDSGESGHPVNSFDLFCYYDHNNDRSSAFKAAAGELGIELKRQRAEPAQPETKQPEPEPVQEQVSEPAPTEPEPEAPHFDFITLGFNDGSGYFLPKRTEQVTRFSLGSLRKQHLLQLASLAWWESYFPTKNGIDWDAAYDAVNRWCEKAGIYDPANQRGRGAWYDNGRSILHLGDRLMIDNGRTNLTDYRGQFIYARQPAFENGFDAVPATTEDGAKLAQVMEGLNWARPEHAIFTMGWVALAPICGALQWRPHLWVTAQRGAGKSWLQENIIDKLVGRMMVYCQGGTTEAGIRQKIQYDARPVMFDEAESENQQAMSRIQHVIELARQSSTDGGAEIMKGTANGTGMSFRMRSMFMMGSINVGLKQAADESRFTVVTLNKAEKTAASVDRFRAFESKVLETLNEDFCRSVRARAYHMIPVIRQNAKTFSTAVAKQVGSQRIGDQIGTLLAGYWALLDDGIFEVEEAVEIVKRLNLDEAQEAEQVSDEDNCLSRIMQRQVRVDGINGAINRSIGELIQVAVTRIDSVAITASMASDVLPRFGIAVEKGRVYFSNTHNEIENCLTNTAWQNGWARILLRVDGAEKGQKTYRFAGSSTRFVSLPVEVFE
jgi:hypothetical protein